MSVLDGYHLLVQIRKLPPPLIIAGLFSLLHPEKKRKLKRACLWGPLITSQNLMMGMN